MTRERRDSQRLTPFHGLVLLGLAGLLLDCCISAHQFWPKSGPNPGNCVYQVFADEECAGTLFLERPENLSRILSVLGLKNHSDRDCGRIPCNRAIKLNSGDGIASVGKIQGTHLIAAGKRIDVNLADRDDLKAVPGIGPKLSERIIAARDSRGGFRTVEELQTVPGIGRKKLSKMMHFLEVGPSDISSTSQAGEPVPRLIDLSGEPAVEPGDDGY
ncbi:MAG TPA: helix-hairpin-helix domain-containing protein [Desulfomonilaceae bacterium]|nr:helix-hairpin-helix domain-containing protein [Desulfomonilaceae bacterium]